MPKLIFSFAPEVKLRVFFTEKIEEHFDPTDENDYIYDGNTIVYYIGTSKRPEIPQTLGGVQVLAVERTAFNDTDVEAVKFPDGMEVIE